MLGKLALEEQAFTEAESYFEWARTKMSMPLLQHLASIRLAKVWVLKGQYTKALALIDNMESQGRYQRFYEEIKGDIYVKQAQTEKARVAYQKAIDTAKLGTPVFSLQLKLQSLPNQSTQ